VTVGARAEGAGAVEVAATESHMPVLEAIRIAPSVHNTQPWRAAIRGAGELRLEWARERTLTTADPEGFGASFCIGCAVEAAASVAEVEFQPGPGESSDPGWYPGDLRVERIRHDYQRQMGLLRTRRTNRAPYFETPPPNEAIEAVLAAAAPHGVGAHAVIDRASIVECAELASAGTADLLSQAGYRDELLDWLRPVGRGRDTPDGLTGDTLQFGRAAARGVELLKRSKPARAIAGRVGFPAMMAARTRTAMAASGFLVLLVVRDFSPAGRLAAGRGMMAGWLAATRAGLAAQPVSDALPFPERVERLASLFGHRGDGMPFVMLRIGYPTRLAPPAGRRPLGEIVRRG
jgi:nitroreductase